MSSCSVGAANDVLVHLRRCPVEREIAEITDELGRISVRRSTLPLSPTSSSSAAAAAAALIDNHVVPDKRR